MVVAVIGLVYGGYRWRVRVIERHNRQLEAQVAVRTQELQARTQELEESEARFRGLSTSTFEAVVIHEQGQILDANQTTVEMFGYTRAELLGKYINDLLAPESQQLAAQQIQVETEEVYEVEALTKDGRVIPLEVRAKMVPYQERQVRVVAARDLTERKQIEAQKQRLVAMEERERIGRELHDDLGQVMGYVSLQAQAAREFLNHDQIDRPRTTLTQLVQAAHEAHSDVRQYILGIRTATQPASGFFEELNQYLRQFHQRYDLDVQVSRPDDLLDSPMSFEVETQLLRIIQEALTNVRKHACVEVARLFFTLHPDEIQVIIADEGCGFNPYLVPAETSLPKEGEQTSPPLRGIEGGLETSEPQKRESHFGLEIMRERAEAIGGSLEVRSSPDKGAQVIVRLPRVLEKPPEKEVRGLRVLLVDDHPLYLEGLRNMLSVRGIQVLGAAHDGLEAQELARKLLPDLILMDVEMPRCNGLEATRRIKADLPDTKIVMLTVAADDETLFEALKYGASGYLLKNLDSRQFFTLLTEVMRGKTVLSPTLAARVLTEFAQRDPAATAEDEETPPTLTVRQYEILELVAQGLTNKEIAKMLHLSRDTVKYHITQILERLQLKSRYELAQYARQQGLTDE